MNSLAERMAAYEDLIDMERNQKLHRASSDIKDSVMMGDKPKFVQKLLHKYFEENYIHVAHLPAIITEG